jgi:hypothetical protein
MAGDMERLKRVFSPPPGYYDVRGTATFELVRACRALRTFLVAERREVGLYEGRDLILLEIARREGRATPKHVEETLGIKANTLSTVLRRCVDAGAGSSAPGRPGRAHVAPRADVDGPGGGLPGRGGVADRGRGR